MLSILRKNAAACTNYLRMKDLPPGRYEIRKFSLRNSKFGGKCLVIDIPKRGYIFLPQNMTEDFNTEEAVNKLNQDRYDFIYKGEDNYAPNDMRFTFEMHCDDESEDDDDDDDDNKGGAARNVRNKASKTSAKGFRNRTDEIDFIDSGHGSSANSDGSRQSDRYKKNTNATKNKNKK